MSAQISPYGGRGPGVVGVGWALAVVSGILIAVRTYVRFGMPFRSKNSNYSRGTWALFWAVSSWMIVLLSQSITTVAAWFGAGNHLRVIEEAGAISQFNLWDFITNAIFLVGIASGKIAAASFLLAVTDKVKDWKTYLLHFIAYSNGVIIIPNIFLVFFQCTPAAHLWDMKIHGHCPRAGIALKYTMFQGSYCAISDLTLALLPIFIVWNLQAPRRTKVSLVLLMGFGVFAAIFAALRTYHLKDLHAGDAPYVSASLDYWAEAECFTVIIACSIPPAWPLVRKLRGERRRRSSDFVPLHPVQQSHEVVPSGGFGTATALPAGGENRAESPEKPRQIEQPFRGS